MGWVGKGRDRMGWEWMGREGRNGRENEGKGKGWVRMGREC